MQSSNEQSGHREPMADRDGRPPKTIQPTPIRDGSRIERTVWVVLLLLPLLAYCVVAVLAYSIKPTPINTGDTLYDKYLAWVADELENSASSGISNVFRGGIRSNAADAEQDPFADWEAEFGDDPRYWMLRYRYSESAETYSGPYYGNVIRHLERAHELGAADGAIMLNLLWACENSRGPTDHYNSPGRHDSLETVAAMLKEKRAQIDRQIGEEHSQLLAGLLEVAGDVSLPHYYAAIYDAERGDYSAALSHLAAGNRAPRNSCLRGFPAETIITDIEAGKPLPDKLISGSTLVDQMYRGSPNFVNFTNMLRLLVADAIEKNDLAALDELHTCACRIGSLSGNGGDSIYMGLTLCAIVQNELVGSKQIPLAQQQHANLGNLAVIRGQILNQASTNMGSMQYFNPLAMPLPARVAWFVEAGLSGGRSFKQEYNITTHDDHVHNLAALGYVNQLFGQLESFNYNTLEFE